MRKIVTYNTLGENMVEVYSSAMVWGELQPDLTRAGVRYEGLRAMTNPGQVTLESLQAELPEGEFQLFLMPQKVKSGWDEDDEEMIEEDGIRWEDEDWTIYDPEDFTFVSNKDLAIARSKRAFYLLGKAIETLSEQDNSHTPISTPLAPRDPILEKLKAQAAEMQRNMDMFN